MHPSAYKNCEVFKDKYCGDFYPYTSIVVDFGSANLNGTLKPIFEGFNYKGLDIREGANVDIVCHEHNVPFPNGTVDIVLSNSNFEHDDLFWITFLEMCRITKPGGLIYINAPSSGMYHPWPVDCWRFYADSWAALAKWARRNNYEIELLESYIDDTPDCTWKNSVGIFKKTK